MLQFLIQLSLLKICGCGILAYKVILHIAIVFSKIKTKMMKWNKPFDIEIGKLILHQQ